MKITWYGTASIGLQAGREKILFDPFVTLRGAENKTSVHDFSNYRTIFLTHGHLDHLASIPQIVKNRNTKIYCTPVPAGTLRRKGVSPEKLHTIKPGRTIQAGGIRLTVLPGKHVIFDKKLVLGTMLSPRFLRYAYNIPYLYLQNRKCPEKHETVSYLIETEGRRILLLGSMGIDMYPVDVDLLILPYQGTSNLICQASEIVARVQPKTIFLDHFDNAFPPLSQHIDTEPFEEHMKKTFPQINIICPKAKVAYEF